VSPHFTTFFDWYFSGISEIVCNSYGTRQFWTPHSAIGAFFTLENFNTYGCFLSLIFFTKLVAFGQLKKQHEFLIEVLDLNIGD